MELKSFLGIVRARWRLLAVTTLLGVLGAALASTQATQMYTATATTFVTVTGGVGPSDVPVPQESLYVQDQVDAYVSAVDSDVVMAAVIDELGLALTSTELADKVEVTNPLDTPLLEVSATDPSPWVAQSIANSATGQLRAWATDLAGASAGDSLATLQDIAPASLPTSPSSPVTWAYLAVGLLVGLAIGMAATVLGNVVANSSSTGSLESGVS